MGNRSVVSSIIIHPAEDPPSSDGKDLSLWGMLPIFGLVLSVYAWTLAPGLLGGDAGEFQLAAHVWGLTHPTGYPLYSLLLKLWAFLPVGTIAYRSNLLAAVLSATAIVVCYLILLVLTGRIWISVFTSLLLAFSPLYWSQAVVADKYALNALLVLAVLAAAAFWDTSPRSRRLYLLALVYGISLTHHRTMLFFAPGLLGFVLWKKPTLWRSRQGWIALGYLLLPLSLYIYLPLVRTWGQPLSNWWPSSPSDWWAYMSARGHLEGSLVSTLPLTDRLARYTRVLTDQFTVAGGFLALWGMLSLWRRNRPLAFLTTVSFGFQSTASAWYYQEPRHQVFFLPSLLIAALWIGIGGAALLHWGENRQPVRRRMGAGLVALVVACLGAISVISLVQTGPEMYNRYHRDRPLDGWRQNLRSGQQAQRFAVTSLSNVAPGSIVICDWEQTTPLRYVQQVDGLRPDVQVIYPIEQVEQITIGSQPIYISRAYPGLAERWHLSNSGPLIALHLAPNQIPPSGIIPWEVRWQDSVALLGLVYRHRDLHSGGVIALSLYWKATQDLNVDYSVSLRLLNQEGQSVAHVDSQHPVLGTYPTSLWSQSEIVEDYYELELPSDLPPGLYHWGLILYRSLPGGGWENLPLANGGAEIAIGPEITVQGR